MPLRARDAVGGVAAQRDEVGHLRGRHPVAPAHLVGVDGLGAPAAGADVEHGHAVVAHWYMSRSPVITSARAAGVRLARGRRSRAGRRPRASRARRTIQPNASKNPRAVGELGRQRVGHLGPLRVVAVEQLDAVVGGVGAEAEHHRARGVLLDLAQDEVGGAEQRVDRQAVLALDRVRQRVEGAEQHRGGVDG